MPTCGRHLEFPDLGCSTLLSCYACLRADRAALTKDTELGMIRHEDAMRGITHGIPGLDRPSLDLVPLSDGWVAARLLIPTMLELLRGPKYSTIQGERWLFCCKMPMVYVGRWSREKFPDVSFHRTLPSALEGQWQEQPADGIYVFRCAACRRHSAHWDIC